MALPLDLKFSSAGTSLSGLATRSARTRTKYHEGSYIHKFYRVNLYTVCRKNRFFNLMIFFEEFNVNFFFIKMLQTSKLSFVSQHFGDSFFLPLENWLNCKTVSFLAFLGFSVLRLVLSFASLFSSSPSPTNSSLSIYGSLSFCSCAPFALFVS